MCYNIGGEREYLHNIISNKATSKGFAITLKKFSIPLDKLWLVWYNVTTKKLRSKT